MPYFPLAILGWTADKLLSAALSAAAGWIAFRIARHAGIRNAWAAALFAWAQPLYFQLAQTTLTETPLAFYLAAAVLLAVRGRWEWSSVILSLGFVTRHEAILFLPIWAYFAWRAGVNLLRLWPLAWAPIGVNAAAWLAGMTTAIELYFQPKPSSQYGSDGWLTFVARSMHAWGPGVSVLAFAGLAAMLAKGGGLRQTRGDPGRAHDSAAMARKLVCACIAAYFIAQTIIRVFGLFDSGGYARFLVPIGPLVGIAALAGWNGLFDADQRGRLKCTLLVAAAMALLWFSLELQVRLHRGIDIEFPKVKEAQVAIRVVAIVFALLACTALLFRRRESRIIRLLTPGALIALMLFTGYILHRPLQPPEEAPIIADALAELEKKGLGDRPLVSALLWIDYEKKQALPPNRPSTRKRIEDAPVGTLIAWEQQFAGSHDHQLNLEEFTNTASFRRVLTSPPKPRRQEPYLHVFEKVAEWPSRIPAN
ncbi:MAG: hypothetical protein IPK83_03180 [Planctomycetes bacterium]|nr:hypothetical protein [Planctomycetota bacterium]